MPTGWAPNMARKRPRSTVGPWHHIRRQYYGPHQNPIYRPWRSARTSRPFRPGFNRTGGFYGRFSRGSKKYGGYLRVGESKFHDFVLDTSPIPIAGVVQPTINIIAEGTSERERNGRKAIIRKIHWNMNFKIAGQSTTSADVTSDSVRCILFQDKQANGATAAVLDILETADFQSYRNLAQERRFKILADLRITMNTLCGAGRGSTDTMAWGAREYNTTFNKNCYIPIHWNNTTGALTEMRSNNIGVLLISESALVTLNSQFRLRFNE